MKTSVEKRNPEGVIDRIAIALTTWGVGYLPIAPGTWGSIVGVAIYFGIVQIDGSLVSYLGSIGISNEGANAVAVAANAVLLSAFIIVGIWASGRTIPIFGNSDPSEAVVDEVMGQLIALLFIPITAGWWMVLTAFLLFRLFDIWKPYPIDSLQDLPGGVGICADDIVAGIYAGVGTSVIYAVFLLISR